MEPTNPARQGGIGVDAKAFWTVIAHYNEQTWGIQIILLAAVLFAIVLSYRQNVRWAAKASLGILNLFIGLVFFAGYGTEPIQTYFALPLFLFCGILFLYECRRRPNDVLETPNKPQTLLWLLYLLYPFVSILFGNAFPQMVTYIMPCPAASLSIMVYTGYHRKNKVLLALLTIWGLTGIKSIFFHAYEDLILLICGLYGAAQLISEIRSSKVK